MLQYLVMIVLMAHGIGHVTGIMRSWTSIEVGFSDKPWILGGNHTMESTVGKAWGVLWLVALFAFLGSGISVAMGSESWRYTALIGSVFSILAIVPWWNTVMTGAKAGVILDLAIILVLLLPWGEKITDFFEVT